MFALPLTGYLDSAWDGLNVSFFNGFDIPLAFGKDEAKFEIVVAVHRWTAYGLFARRTSARRSRTTSPTATPCCTA